MNVLITSAGRRTSLLNAFRVAAEAKGGKVYALDLDPLAPANFLAHGAFQAPRVTSSGYVPRLLELVEKLNIKLIVPTIDTELQVLAEHAEDFLRFGARALISTPDFVRICGDKWLTHQAFMRSGVTVPASWLPGITPEVLSEDLFLKPRDGSASQHTHACLREDLEHILPLVPNPIIQERLKGREITIDALFDFEGRPLHFVPRERIRTLGGESIQGVTLGNEELETWLSNVLDACSLLGARGAITLQAFLTPLGPVLTEVNPRFGGGFPLANAAGGNYPQWLLAMLAGEPINPRMGAYIRGLYMTRCYTEVFTETLPWPR